MTKNISCIEKCAKLMGIDYYGHAVGKVYRSGLSGYDQEPVEFNPLTNKSDLMDLECAIGIDVGWHDDSVIAKFYWSGIVKHKAWANFKDHPDKQTALAHAVVDVACQIYDRKFGGE